MENQISQQQENEWKAVAVPLSQAQDWVTQWIDTNTIGNTSFKPTDLRAFVVRRSDFVQLLAQTETEYVRMYIGLKPNPDSKNGQEPCLILASAAVKGTTMLHYEGDDKDNIIDLIGEQKVYNLREGIEVSENYQVFDVSRPCPPICDPKSPLFVPSADGSTCA